MAILQFWIVAIAFALVLLAVALLIGSILLGLRGLAALTGSTGISSSRKKAIGSVVIGLIGVAGLLAGVWLAARTVARPTYSVDDKTVQPYLSALAEVDRASWGFTPLSEDARIEIEHANGTREYDVMLHVYAETSRTIAFRQAADGSYEWIGEQETFSGPRRFQSADGVTQERIMIVYDKVPIFGPPLNRVFIIYLGDDSRLAGRLLTLQEVQPILEEWRDILATPSP